MKIAKATRMQTGSLNTPVQKLVRLSAELGVDLYLKRDDLSGVGLGGSGLRGLEYLVADALAQRATVLLTYSRLQSDHARLTAAMAAKHGLKCVVLMGEPPSRQATGSLLATRLLGAELFFLDGGTFQDAPEEEHRSLKRRLTATVTRSIVAEYEARGERVYVIPEEGASPLGALGYMLLAREIGVQQTELGLRFDYVAAPLDAGAIFAGLCLGERYFRTGFHPVGVCTTPSGLGRARLNTLLERTNLYWELDLQIALEDLLLVTVADGVREAIGCMARTEGILLGPTATGPTLQGLIQLVEEGRVPSGSRVLLLHTGGTPALFAAPWVEELQGELWDGKKQVFSYHSEIEDRER